jgi:predicted phosphoribosyltransferase
VAKVIFQNRREAGRALAEAIAQAPELKDAVVLGLARGGVPVAFEVAIACELALDVLIVRKLGAPACPEFAMGAVAGDGSVVLNQDALSELRVTPDQLHTLIERQRREIARLEHAYREGRPPLEFGESGVILVDDGLATGASMRAAIQSVRPRARQITIAVPVGAKSTCNALRKEVDRMICVAMPDPLDAVSIFYREFDPTSDDEVRALLREARRRH